MILLLDAFDSFSGNIHHAFLALGSDCNKVRIDHFQPKEHLHDHISGIVLGPGPGSPRDYPAYHDMIGYCLQNEIPLLGICLGQQALCEYFGGVTVRAQRPIHGHDDILYHRGHPMYRFIPRQFKAGRYHSLESFLPENSPLSGTSWSSRDGALMSVALEERPVWGVQYHPESILSPHGEALIKNWIAMLQARLK